jgi:hypothetical protein
MALENRIKVLNKLIGLITRKFSTNISKDVQIRFHKMTANLTLLFGFGTWLLKVKDKKTGDRVCEVCAMQQSG